MSDWTESFYSQLEAKREGISNSDFRFYNLGHLPLMAAKTNELSTKCEHCQENLNVLNALVEDLPASLQNTASRRVFEKTKTGVEKHLKSVHNIRLANYYYALYAFWGGVFGATIGAGIVLGVCQEFILGGIGATAVIGMIIGQIIGKRKDSKLVKNHSAI